MSSTDKLQGDADATPSNAAAEFWAAVKCKDWPSLAWLAVALAEEGKDQDTAPLLLIIATLAAKVPPEPEPKASCKRTQGQELQLGRRYDEAMNAAPKGDKLRSKEDIAKEFRCSERVLDGCRAKYRAMVAERGVEFANFSISVMCSQTPKEEPDAIDLIQDILGAPDER